MKTAKSTGSQLAGEHLKRIAEIGQLDFSATIAGRRIRINLFRQQGSVSAALRILSNTIPQLEDLGLPQAVRQFSRWNKGIVLVTGETGSGKSTTLAAILDEINRNRPLHIITLEDPIEYVYTPQRAIINQRRMGWTWKIMNTDCTRPSGKTRMLFSSERCEARRPLRRR